MKKSVVILLAIVCALSVLLISFMGRATKHNDETVYAKSIRMNDYDSGYKQVIDGVENLCYYKTVYYDDHGYARYQIDCEVLPLNATNNKKIFVKATNTVGVSVDMDTGLVEITSAEREDTVAVVYIYPADGTVLEKPVRMSITARPAN